MQFLNSSRQLPWEEATRKVIPVTGDMGIKEEIIGKEVVDVKALVVGQVKDVDIRSKYIIYWSNFPSSTKLYYPIYIDHIRWKNLRSPSLYHPHS